MTAAAAALLSSLAWTISSHNIYAQQITNLIGFIFIIITIWYLQQKIQPVERRKLG